MSLFPAAAEFKVSTQPTATPMQSLIMESTSDRSWMRHSRSFAGGSFALALNLCQRGPHVHLRLHWVSR